MNIPKIRENLGRVKTCINRKELERALELLISAFKELGGQQAPINLRGDFRDAIRDLSYLPSFKEAYKNQIGYQPGKEKELRAIFEQIYHNLTGVDQEEVYEKAMQRKVGIDINLKNARNALSKGQIPEADAFFKEAISFYRDEDILFAMIAKELMEVGENIRALDYIRAGLKKMPQNGELLKMLDACNKARAEKKR